jgi:hypothetical protein
MAILIWSKLLQDFKGKIEGKTFMYTFGVNLLFYKVLDQELPEIEQNRPFGSRAVIFLGKMSQVVSYIFLYNRTKCCP